MMDNLDVDEEGLFGTIDAPVNELTLDEPIYDTLKRDWKSMISKVKHVLMPQSTEESLKELRNWDLWGPLLFCLILSMSLSLTANTTDSGDVFALVFSLFWMGSVVVTINAKLLKGNVSFFQSLCVLGYCLFPMVLGSLAISLYWALDIHFSSTIATVVIDLLRIVLVLGCWLWSNRAATVFLAQLVGEKKRLLAVYPVVLLYSSIAWMILT